MKTLFTNAARRRGVLYATAGVAALAFASPVLAQDSNEGEEEFPTTPIPDTTAPATGDVITVTGSRIRRPEIVGTEPTTSISDDYYEDRNITSTADAINELPQFRGSVSPRGDQASFGAGVNFVNTFGLGSNRTLSLVNGRRVVSSNLPSLFSAGGPGVQVDLNIIPTILIERIDNVFVGGAPVYGS
ncbi:MAG: TonB-dependent receptor plug domain-containing protein, partial [Alteriqipengyuania sp.]